jgi:hypothetical protein
MNQVITEKSNIFENNYSSIVFGFSNLISLNEKVYFKNHLKSLNLLTKTLAVNLDINDDDIQVLTFSNILFSFLINNLPENLNLSSPYELKSVEDTTAYFDYYLKYINNLNSLEFYKKPIRIINQIWEHHDGSGLPNGISDSSLMIESQILLISHIYLNQVYRINHSDYNYLINIGEVKQKYETTLLRHNNAISFIQEKHDWFSKDVFKSFFDLLRSGKSIVLLPESNELSICKYI